MAIKNFTYILRSDLFVVTFNSVLGKWPLKEKVVRRLRRIKPKLIQILDSFSGLIDYMASFGVVSDVDVDKIKSKKTSCKQNAAIVDAVLRRSKQDFENFKTALKKTNQKHVAEYLVEGESIVAYRSSVWYYTHNPQVCFIFEKSM